MLSINHTHTHTAGLLYAYSLLQWSILAAIFPANSYWTRSHPPAPYQDPSMTRSRLKLTVFGCFCLAVLLPLFVCLGHLREGFTVLHSPVFFCSPRDPVYGFVTGFVLPSVASAFALTASMLYFWDVVKVREGGGREG